MYWIVENDHYNVIYVDIILIISSMISPRAYRLALTYWY